MQDNKQGEASPRTEAETIRINIENLPDEVIHEVARLSMYHPNLPEGVDIKEVVTGEIFREENHLMVEVTHICFEGHVNIERTGDIWILDAYLGEPGIKICEQAMRMVTDYLSSKTIVLIEQSAPTPPPSPITEEAGREGQTDWSIPNEKDQIDIPDELYPLFNKLAMQLRFVTHSGKNEVLAVAHMVQTAQEFFAPPTPSKEAEDKKELITIRNNLYDGMQTENVTAWELITLVKKHLQKLDIYIGNSAASPSSTKEEESEDDIREEIYQHLNDGPYGLSAKAAHKLQLHLCGRYSITRKSQS